MAQGDDALLFMPVRPGPTAILRRVQAMNGPVSQEALQLAASLVVRFGRKIKEGNPEGEVQVSLGGKTRNVTALPLDDTLFQAWALE
jgi:hypothetical protein